MNRLWMVIFCLFMFDISVAGVCAKKEEKCISAGIRMINGVEVYKECWEYELKFKCQESSNDSECHSFRQNACEQVSSECSEKNEHGECTLFRQTYKCPEHAATEVEQTVCTDAYCVDGNCADPSSDPDTDFTQGVVMMEAARQAGVYGVAGNHDIKLFAGDRDSCTIKTMAGSTWMSCCKVEGGGQKLTNQATGATNLQNGTGIYSEGSGQTGQMGSSTYTYDNLYEENPLLSNIQAGLTGGWLQCESQERTLSLKRGQNLCEQVGGERCTKELDLLIGKTCIEKTRDFCCFKSKLAKAVNLQGKDQLGLNKNDCRGFSQEELERIDFSKINLDDFIRDIAPKSFSVPEKQAAVAEKVSNMSNSGDYYAE